MTRRTLVRCAVLGAGLFGYAAITVSGTFLAHKTAASVSTLSSTSVSNVVVTDTGPTTAAGGQTIISVAFATSSPMSQAAGDQIFITYPSDTNACTAGGPITDVTTSTQVGGAHHANFAPCNQTLGQLNSGAVINAGDQLSISISGIVLPTIPGNYSLSVSTTSDITAANSNTFNVTPASCPVAVSPKGQPQYVVLVAMGVGFGMREDTFQPLAIHDPTGYCSSSFVEPSLSDLAQYWSPLGPSGQSMLQQLGSEGAVLLPFSYSIATLVGDPSSPASASYNVPGYSTFAPGFNIVEADADAMDATVRSIHHVWPESRIVIVGHSMGGWVAEKWWYDYGRFEYQSGKDWQNVAAEFSLDSPISGVQDAFLCDAPLAAVCTLGPLNVEPAVAAEYFTTWLNRAQIGSDIQNAEDTSYIPIGTYNDPMYSIPDWVFNGMFSQLEFGDGCSLSPVFGNCNPQGFDFGSACNADSSKLTDLTGQHFLVMSCPNVVNYVACVLVHQGPGCTPPTASAKASRVQTRTTAPSGGTTASPQGAFTSDVLAPSASAVIQGKNFGTSTGSVLFQTASGSVAASISSWNDLQVSVAVPNTAVTGPVTLFRSDGFPALVGEETILTSPTNVASLTEASPAVMPTYGQPMTVQVLARDANGLPVAGASISLSDGIAIIHTAQTNAAGIAQLSVTGAATESFVALSGAAYTEFSLSWQAPRPESVTLSASDLMPPAGGAVTISASVTDSSTGAPLPNQTVQFQVLGPSSLVLTPSSASTDLTGKALTNATGTGTGPFVVTATTGNGWFSARIDIRFPTRVPSTSVPDYGLASPALLIGSGAVVVISGWLRRRQRRAKM